MRVLIRAVVTPLYGKLSDIYGWRRETPFLTSPDP